eukprot:10267103-Karenia_brevis.AAC.1
MEEHGMTPMAYRREVLGRALAEWPVEVPAQVLRTRLFAYTHALSDAKFTQGHCACCARRKKQCKLSRVTFPPHGHDVAP